MFSGAFGPMPGTNTSLASITVPRRQQPAASPFGPGATAFGPTTGVVPGAFGAAASPFGPGATAFGAAPTQYTPPPFPVNPFNPTPPAFLTGAQGQPPFGPTPGPFGQIAALGSQGYQRPPVQPQPAMQVFPGASVFSSPAGTAFQPSGQFVREPFYQAPVFDPAYRSRSVEIAATGRGPEVHSSIACSSNLAGLAQRISYMLSGSPSDDNVRLALNTLENCLNERTRAAPQSGMNQAHQTIFDLIDKLGHFIADYYTNAGAARGGMNVQYTGSVSNGFQVTLNNSINYQGRMYTVFAVKPSSTYPVRGGKRKGTRRAKRKSRKTRAHK
jgi:hypothetical protein